MVIFHKKKKIFRLFIKSVKIFVNEKIVFNQFSTETIKIVAKENFMDVWKLYYDMQIQFLLNFKTI